MYGEQTSSEIIYQNLRDATMEIMIVLILGLLAVVAYNEITDH